MQWLTDPCGATEKRKEARKRKAGRGEEEEEVGEEVPGVLGSREVDLDLVLLRVVLTT